MEASVARVRDFVRRQLEGERVWRVGVSLTPSAARVTVHTPEKRERFIDERKKGKAPIVETLERDLNKRFERDMIVDVVQAPVAVAKFIRITPRKVRFVADAIRGKSVQDALAILQFVPNSAAKTMSKLIQSAAANAENNHRMDRETLEVMHIHVDEGPALKRVSPRAMGRAYRILKRTSHITVGLAASDTPSREERRGKGVARTVAKTPRRAPAAKPARAQKAATAEPQAKEQQGPEGGQ